MPGRLTLSKTPTRCDAESEVITISQTPQPQTPQPNQSLRDWINNELIPDQGQQCIHNQMIRVCMTGGTMLLWKI